MKDREGGIDSGAFSGCVLVEHEAADDGEGEGRPGSGVGLIGAGGSEQLGELGQPVVNAFAAKSREPLGLRLSQRVDLVKEPEEGAVGRVGDDRAQGRDKGLEVVRVLLSEPDPAGAEQLASRVGETGGDQGVARAEVMNEHARAGLELVRELSQCDLTTLSGYEHLGSLCA